MTIALLGAGVMGEILLAGLLRAGRTPDEIVATDRRPARAAEIAHRYGVRVVDNADAVAGADTVLLAVKPQDVTDILDEIRHSLAADALVVSLVAGVETDVLAEHLEPGTPVVRVMPNTPAAVGEGMAAISAGAHATSDHLDRVTAILGSVGKVVTVPEKYQNAVTAISGSGPAYLMFVVEAMIDAGVLLGLPRDIATQLVVQTMLGSAKLLSDTGQHPTVLRENVTSPGGTTASALRALEDHRVKAAFITAMEAARDRGQYLADQARAQHAQEPRA